VNDSDCKRIKHGIKHALREENNVIERSMMLNVGVMKQIRRNCITIANRLNIELHNIEHNFNDEDQQNVLKRFFKQRRCEKHVFFEFQQKTKDIE
jgi:hypothetical protein